MIGIGIKNTIDRVGVPFPYSLPSLAAWYARNRGITLNGGNVSQWDDQSGNGRHLIQATATNQPSFESDNTILFDGVDNFFQTSAFTLVQPETIFILFKQVSWTSLDTVFDGESSDTGLLRQKSGGVSPQLEVFAGGISAQNSDLAVGTYGVAAVVFNGAFGSFQIDNNTPLTGDYGSLDMGRFTLGAGGNGVRWANIQVKEVIILGAVPDAATKNLVIDYLLNVVN